MSLTLSIEDERNRIILFNIVSIVRFMYYGISSNENFVKIRLIECYNIYEYVLLFRVLTRVSGWFLYEPFAQRFNEFLIKTDIIHYITFPIFRLTNRFHDKRNRSCFEAIQSSNQFEFL